MLRAMANLFVILAREARTGVIFRRGPSKQVLLIKWNLKNDSFETGQWFKGRIYERRCDLSPSGDLLVYFAGKHKAPLYCWTALSRPPYLTALLLWPKRFGAWRGGGLFEGEQALLLDHETGEFDPADGFQVPKRLNVRPMNDHSDGEGYDPIYHVRLLRDGWVLRQSGKLAGYQKSGPVQRQYTEPRIYEKRSAHTRAVLRLQMRFRAVGDTPEGPYSLEHEILHDNGDSLLTLPGVTWADWDRNGDLLFAEQGRLFRLPRDKNPEADRMKAKELADFSSLSFEAKEAPLRYRSFPA
jgi:hypothetical protein